MKRSSSAFTMIELVFVIVVLGILSAIAIPKFAATRTDAQISKARADVSSIRSAIMTERQSRLIRGDSNYIAGNALDTASGLFGGVLTYGITASTNDGHWSHSTTAADVNSSKYIFHIAGSEVDFTYTRSPNGIFTCDKTAGSTAEQAFCADIID